ncbi:plasmid pRiA4b ORF-3 family protein [Thiorhodococcus mannitoliphagus]|uniref:Plasmid pRiA4b ORF-3 family protein n=1 Tax=Thiorhodococcus mannitoliphagus TaxID=329406 RepID=A0A6P1DMI2_9GAMM|nr:plasmid pRiA4b ORF-3 family protein [Thiorhodococcus mannitoliphagus]NEX19467.1 plasmid pRiA4b ORF-3 family protein [Thiorhodococcus mannitoliphagus]
MTKPQTPARTLTPGHQLDTPDFERQPPGSILHDFEALLGLIGDQGLPVTPGHQFAMKTLESINQHLTHPLELGLKRAMQKSYPHINGLYLVLRASGLAWIDTASKKPRLHLDPAVLASWCSLNAAERYFALLKAWWGRSSEEMIGERESWGGDASMRVVQFLKMLPNRGPLTFETPQDAELLRYSPGIHHLALLDLFGLVELRAMPPMEGKGWQPERVDLSAWGRALLGHFAAFMRQQSLVPEAESDMPILDTADFFDSLARFEHWSQLVRPQIPDWRQELEIPEPPFQAGQHLFKVSLGADCWRRIAIGGETDVDDLADTILAAFDFDDSDHLYRFSYQGRFGRTIAIDHPNLAGESEYVADEIKVGDLALRAGMRIDFLFDFGDRWRFELTVEQVSDGPASQEPQLLEAHVRAPVQYDNW